MTLRDRHIGGATPRPTFTRGVLQRAVRLLDRGGDEDRRAGLQLAHLARHVDDDRRIGGDDDLLLSVLVLQRQHLAVARGGGLLDIAVGHRARRLQVPAAMPVTGATHRLGEDVHLERLLAAVGLRHAGDADVGPGLDIRQRRLDQRHHQRLLRQRHLQLGAAARLDDVGVAFDTFDCASDPDRRLLCRHRRSRNSDKHQCAQRAPNHPRHALLPFPPLGREASSTSAARRRGRHSRAASAACRPAAWSRRR